MTLFRCCCCCWFNLNFVYIMHMVFLNKQTKKNLMSWSLPLFLFSHWYCSGHFGCRCCCCYTHTMIIKLLEFFFSFVIKFTLQAISHMYNQITKKREKKIKQSHGLLTFIIREWLSSSNTYTEKNSTFTYIVFEPFSHHLMIMMTDLFRHMEQLLYTN